MAEDSFSSVDDEVLRLLADDYKRLHEHRARLDEDIDSVKSRIFELTVGRQVSIDLGSDTVVCGSRAASRGINVVALGNAGVPKEMYSKVTPSLRMYLEMADRLKWPANQRDRFLIESDERTQTISIKRKVNQEEQDDDYTG